MDRLQNAQASIEAARIALTQYGDREAAEVLRGVEVYSRETAEVALDTVQRMSPVTDAGQMARVDALCALEAAVAFRPSLLPAVA